MGDPYGPTGDDHDEGQLFEDMVAAAIGAEIPHPIDWTALTATERRDELHRLAAWVHAIGIAWPLTRAELPPCWFQHESLVRTLSAARDAYLTAYDPTQAASAAADWMHIWDATLQRLTRWVATLGCRSEHRTEQAQRWLTATDYRQALAAWVNGDFDARRQAELNSAIDSVSE